MRSRVFRLGGLICSSVGLALSGREFLIMCCDQMTVWRRRWITFAGIRFGRLVKGREYLWLWKGVPILVALRLSGRLTRSETRSHTARSNTNCM